MRHTTPAAPAVRETLERILASKTFARSERARKLLRYLVEAEQAGRAERLKGFAIAMDVFGRAAGFDPSTDAVVRVQAGRLRELLTRYFATEGASEPVRISVPRGGYVPAYEPLAEPAPSPSEQAAFAPIRPDSVRNSPLPMPSSAQVMRHVHLFWAAMGVVIAMLGFLVYLMVESAMPAGDADAAGEATLATSAIPAPLTAETLPPVHISAKSRDSGSLRVAAVLRTALSGFDTIDFIARDHDGAGNASPDDAIRFVFSVSPGPTTGSVTIELQNMATAKVLLSRVLAPPEIDPTALHDNIADIVSATIPASGTIYAYVERNGLQSGLVSCLLLNDDYYLDQQPAKHEAAYPCLEKLVAVETKSPLVYSELAALHLEAVTDGYPYPSGATAEQAMALAHRAVLMGATSPYAHRAYGFLNSRVGSQEESIRWMRKAYELNTYDLSMAAAYGYALIFSGNYRDGTPIMERAVGVSSAHPSWWDYGLFLGQFMLGDMERAAHTAESLATVRRSYYLAARIVVAKAAGKAPVAAELMRELIAQFPKFAADPVSAFRKGNYPVDLTEQFVGALRAAGLGRAS